MKIDSPSHYFLQQEIKRDRYRNWADHFLLEFLIWELLLGIDILKKYDPNSFVLEWLKNLNSARPFEEFNPISTWINQPMLIIGGHWDPHLKGAFDLYKKSKEAGGSPEIIIGNATHLNWWE